MPRPLSCLPAIQALAAAQDQVLTRAQILDCGLSASGLQLKLAHGQWRRILSQVYYLPGRAQMQAPTPQRSLLRASQLRYGPGVVAGYSTAATAHGLPDLLHAGSPPAVEVITPNRITHQPVNYPNTPRLIVHHGWLQPHEILRRGGFALTTPARTVADLLCLLPYEQAVCLADAALHVGCLGWEQLLGLRASVAGRVGCPTARRAIDAARVGTQSPLETRVRLACVQAGIEPDALQYPVRDQFGAVLGYADMAWIGPGGVLALECDGHDVHSQPSALFRDRYRQNGFMLNRCLLIRVTSADLHEPGRISELVREGLAQIQAKAA